MSEIARISVPLTVWLTAFSAVYGLQGLVCSERWAAFGLDMGSGRAALLLAAGLAIAVQAGLLAALRRPAVASPSATVQRISVGLAAVALVAAVWTLFPVVALPLCA